jgi:hypothetical protein
MNTTSTAHPSAEIELMTRIRDKWGATIADARKNAAIPEAFLAALVANETGGNADAKRFEHGVLAALWEVLQGRKAAYGSIGRDDLFNHIALAVGTQPPLSASGLVGRISNALQFVDGLATSWGLTQVMGYEAIVFGVSFADLQNPVYGLRTSLRMLSQFAERYQLDLGKDFSELLDCWNSGRPHSPTADPQYIPNGLLRMQIYQTLLPPKAMTA